MSKQPKIRNRFGRERRFTTLAVPPKGALAQQQFKEECDMNRIVKKAMNGIPPKFMARGVASYGDFSNVPDLTETYNVMARAEEAFMTLPAELRLELGNDFRNITNLTKDQVQRFKLGKEEDDLPAEGSSPSQPPKASQAPKKGPSKAGQAAPAGTEPADD